MDKKNYKYGKKVFGFPDVSTLVTSSEQMLYLDAGGDGIFFTIMEKNLSAVETEIETPANCNCVKNVISALILPSTIMEAEPLHWTI